MGKKLVINGADFSQNGIHTNFYGITDEQFLAATIITNSSTVGFSIIDQSNIQGKTIHGVRLNVSQAGSINFYKTNTNKQTASSQLTLVGTITATSTGLQNLDFAEPFNLTASEWLVVGKNGDNPSLKFMYDYSTETGIQGQEFFYYTGLTTITYSQSQLTIDFY